jgi:hypothetical protein
MDSEEMRKRAIRLWGISVDLASARLRPLPYIRYRRRRRLSLCCCLVATLFVGFGVNAQAYSDHYPPPPPDKNVTISNGGLSITFNIAWGASVIAITNKNVAHGLNIVDSNDVGRELQPCQFLALTIGGVKNVIVNPTQAGAQGGGQPFYQHPNGVLFPEKGSPVVRWKADADHFHAVIKPLDYNTGNPSNWVYVEDAVIDSQGVAHFHYTFHNHEPKTYSMTAELPTLYSGRTDAFMYPLVSPYEPAGAALRKEKDPNWPLKLVTGAPAWPQKAGNSKGWIANIDSTDHLGIFYTTPSGLAEDYGTFAGADIDVSDRPPLGKTNVVAPDLTSYPGSIYSIEFSVLVSTPERGPALISKQPAAVFNIVRNTPPSGSGG